MKQVRERIPSTVKESNTVKKIDSIMSHRVSKLLKYKYLLWHRACFSKAMRWMALIKLAFMTLLLGISMQSFASRCGGSVSDCGGNNSVKVSTKAGKSFYASLNQAATNINDPKLTSVRKKLYAKIAVIKKLVPDFAYELEETLKELHIYLVPGKLEELPMEDTAIVFRGRQEEILRFDSETNSIATYVNTESFFQADSQHSDQDLAEKQLEHLLHEILQAQRLRKNYPLKGSDYFKSQATSKDAVYAMTNLLMQDPLPNEGDLRKRISELNYGDYKTASEKTKTPNSIRPKVFGNVVLLVGDREIPMKKIYEGDFLTEGHERWVVNEKLKPGETLKVLVTSSNPNTKKLIKINQSTKKTKKLRLERAETASIGGDSSTFMLYPELDDTTIVRSNNGELSHTISSDMITYDSLSNLKPDSDRRTWIEVQSSELIDGIEVVKTVYIELKNISDNQDRAHPSVETLALTREDGTVIDYEPNLYAFHPIKTDETIQVKAKDLKHPSKVVTAKFGLVQMVNPTTSLREMIQATNSHDTGSWDAIQKLREEGKDPRDFQRKVISTQNNDENGYSFKLNDEMLKNGHESFRLDFVGAVEDSGIQMNTKHLSALFSVKSDRINIAKPKRKNTTFYIDGKKFGRKDYLNATILPGTLLEAQFDASQEDGLRATQNIILCGTKHGCILSEGNKISYRFTQEDFDAFRANDRTSNPIEVRFESYVEQDGIRVYAKENAYVFRRKNSKIFPLPNPSFSLSREEGLLVNRAQVYEFYKNLERNDKGKCGLAIQQLKSLHRSLEKGQTVNMLVFMAQGIDPTTRACVENEMQYYWSIVGNHAYVKSPEVETTDHNKVKPIELAK